MASALRERILQAVYAEGCERKELWQQPYMCDIIINVVYAAGSRGENTVEDRIMQQSQADFAWTLCNLAGLTRKA